MPSSDETAVQVLRRLEQVPLLIAMSLQHLAKPGGDSTPLAAWMAAYMALDTLDNEVSRLIEEARELVRGQSESAAREVVNSGPTPER